MRPLPTLVLAAVVSSDEGRMLEKNLKREGFEVRRVDDARDAETEFSSHVGSSVLVIDSGLLLMPHDGQWRGLRERQPSLGAVVRSLLRHYPIHAVDGERTLLVHPDDHDGLVRSIRELEEGPASG